MCTRRPIATQSAALFLAATLLTGCTETIPRLAVYPLADQPRPPDGEIDKRVFGSTHCSHVEAGARLSRDADSRLSYFLGGAAIATAVGAATLALGDADDAGRQRFKGERVFAGITAGVAVGLAWGSSKASARASAAARTSATAATVAGAPDDEVRLRLCNAAIGEFSRGEGDANTQLLNEAMQAASELTAARRRYAALMKELRRNPTDSGVPFPVPASIAPSPNPQILVLPPVPEPETQPR